MAVEGALLSAAVGGVGELRMGAAAGSPWHDGMSQIQGALAATTPHELSNTPIKSNNFT